MPYILIIVFLIIIYMNLSTSRHMQQRILQKKRKGESLVLKEMAERYIDRDCIIYVWNNNQIIGVIREVTEGAILLENENGASEVVNLDYVIRIREYPRKKNGKKKSVVLD